MNIFKGLQKLVAGEFFENEVNSQEGNENSSFSITCCGNWILQQSLYQSSTKNSNVKPKKYVVNGMHIQEDKLLSEGGYGYVWKAKDLQSSEVYAAKRMICQSEEKIQVAQKELEMMYKLPHHENIVKFIEGEIFRENESTSQAVFIMEYCPDGTLFNVMERKMKEGGLKEREILGITLQVCQGLKVLHSLNISHRDLKVENVLIKDGNYKICDFGSASTDFIDLSTLDRKKLAEQEDLYERYTTLQSRPPEMCDIYCGEVVGTKVDIWMLGCMVFCLCFLIHPFYEASKLAIIGANFKFKQNSTFSQKMHDFIRNLLTPSPQYRPSIDEVIKVIEEWDSLSEIPLNQQAKQTKENEIRFEEDMRARDIKVKEKYEKKREEERQMKLQQLQEKQPKLANKSSEDDWGEFQESQEKTQTNKLEMGMEDIDFASFQPNKTIAQKDKNDFDFSPFS